MNTTTTTLHYYHYYHHFFTLPVAGVWKRRKFFLENWQLLDVTMPKNVDFHIYDALLAYGLAISNSVKKSQDLYDSNTIVNNLKSIDFIGVTGLIHLNSIGDRDSIKYEILNVAGNKNANIFASWTVEQGLTVVQPNITFLPGNLNLYQLKPLGLLLQNSSRGENAWYSVPFPPVARYGYTVQVLEDIEVMYMFGGSTGSVLLNDLWYFDFKLNRWSEVYPSNAAISVRKGHISFVWANQLYIFGGYNGQYFMNTLHQFNTRSLLYSEIVTQEQSAATSSITSTTSTTTTTSTSTTTTSTSTSTTTIPSPRAWMSSVFDSKSERLFLFGGEDLFEIKNDLWTFFPRNNTWQQIIPSPLQSLLTISKRSMACLVYYEQMLFVYGGKDANNTALNDLWYFSLQSNTWTRVTQYYDGM